MPSRIPLLLGAGNMGAPGTQTRIQDPAEVQKIVDVMLTSGYVGIDTAQVYGDRTCEQLIGSLDLRERARIDTKTYPEQPGGHNAAKIKEGVEMSLGKLGISKIRVFYLHAPDRSTPYEETLEALNDMYNQGSLEEIGLSNFMSWEVAEIVGICERRGFKKPTVYQGIYSILERSAEGELFPCLRKFGIRFAAYSILAGGYLTGKHLPATSKSELSETSPIGEHQYSHFSSAWVYHAFYTRYLKMATAVTELQIVASRHDLTLAEVAYRWLQWHSKMIPEDHGLILGGSTVKQFEDAIADCSKGPLPDEVVQACEKTWADVKGVAKNYYF